MEDTKGTRNHKIFPAAMAKVSAESLVNVARLTIPKSQVIVINANLGCACCRERFHRIMIRITGLKEYTVNVKNCKVTIRGNVKLYEALKTKMESSSLRRILVGWIARKFHRIWL